VSAAEAAESEPRPLQPPAGVASILSMPRCARPWAAPPTHGAQPRHHQAAPQWGRLKASLSLLASTESPPRSINQTPVGPQMAALPRRLAASFDSQRAGATVAAVASEARAGTGQISPSPTTFLFLPLEGRASGASWAHPLLSESRPHSRNGAEPGARSVGRFPTTNRAPLHQLWLALCRHGKRREGPLGGGPSRQIARPRLAVSRSASRGRRPLRRSRLVHVYPPRRGTDCP
jgi:hypothetical protein